MKSAHTSGRLIRQACPNDPPRLRRRKKESMTLSVEEMNKQLPVANALPGETVPYYMASGEGARYEIDGQLMTVIARAADTGGIFSAAYISGGMGAESPFVSH